MKIKAVIFDLDGTLVNSIEDLADSMNCVLRENNLPEHPVDSYYGFVGMGIKKMVINALPVQKRIDDIIEKCFVRMTELYQINITNKTKPYEGIPEMLDGLNKRGVKIAVLSNKADNLTKKVVNKIFSEWDIEIVMGPATDSLRKPNPENTLLICKSLGVDPSEVAYVGDTGTDMQTANNAGVWPIGVLWGFRDEKELVANGAKSIIIHPLELCGMLNK